MATYNPSQFSEPDKLKEFDPALLAKLLQPFQKYLASRRIKWPPKKPADINYEKLSNVLMNPDETTPPELPNALYCISEMSDPDIAKELFDTLQTKDVAMGPKPTSADIVVLAWLSDQKMLERKHAEQQVTRQRTFEHYQTDMRPVPKFRVPSPQTLSALERHLDAWFIDKKRGRGTRIFMFPREQQQSFWFLVRHGDLYNRQGTVSDKGQSESIYFRPEKHDILIYNTATGELKIHAASAWEVDLYREAFGQYIFRDKKVFDTGSKYTLEPLRLGPRALVATDIHGIEWVRLKEYQLSLGGPGGELLIMKGKNLYDSWYLRNYHFYGTQNLPIEVGTITSASLSVKFTGKPPRTVTIRPSNLAKYTRDHDAVIIEDFLRKRGFLITDNEKRKQDK